MARTTVRVEAYLPSDDYGYAWTNISSDIPGGVKAKWGIDGSGPKDRMADPGTMQFDLDNSARCSGGLVGYYSPGHVNCRDGWDIGTQVRLVLAHPVHGERVKWLGTVQSCPLKGGIKAPSVSVTCVDWLEEAAKTKPDGVAVLENTQSDAVFSALVAVVPKQPAATLIIAGSDNYPYALDTLQDENSNVLAEIHKVALSEFGLVYVQAGTLVFEGRRRRSGASSIRCALTERTILDATITQDRDDIYNRIQAQVHPRRVDDDSSTILFNLGNRPAIKRQSSITFDAPYRDPNQQAQRVAGIDMVTPVATTDYTFNTWENGGGLDKTSQLTVAVTFGGNAARVTVTNSGPRDGYLTKFQLRGCGVYDFEPVLVQMKDDAAIAVYGETSILFDMPHQSDTAIAYDTASFISLLWGQPGVRVKDVTIVAWDDEMAQHILDREISDRISITISPVLDVSRLAWINGIELTVSPAGVVQEKWTLAPADDTRFWRLGIVGQSELDVTTVLGYGLFVPGWVLDESSLGVDTIVQ